MLLTTLLCALLCPTIYAAQLAFPAAEGFGRFAQGGRTGSAYIVSTLADSGGGSLRDALSQPNRIITFNVSGVIHIKKRLVTPKYTSILGQTAPGVGITVYGNGWSFSNANESIIRYVRMRMGTGGDAGKDALTVAHGTNMIFDHLSVSWGRDENFSINGEKAGSITIQDCVISQGLEGHSAGGLIQTQGGISLFRNLYADNKTRNPKVKGKNDFVNNVVYNWGGGGGYIAGGNSEGQSHANIVGNYFIAGPSTGSTPAFVRGNANFHATVQGNYVDHDRDGRLNGKELPTDSKSYGGLNIVKGTFGYPGPARVLSASDALTEVLKGAGTSRIRDAVDEAVIREVRSWGKTGKLIRDESETPWDGGFKKGGDGKKDKGKSDGGKKEKGKGAQSNLVFDLRDQDGDGIPDYYELERGWDVERDDAMVIEPSGYTRLEEWANSLTSASYIDES
jgi:hypothetical protein